MDRVFIVSYPRSGQNYLQRMLQIVSDQDNYCELYTCLAQECPGRELKASQRVPCLAGRRFQKNHDFDLQLPHVPEAKYLILYRTPIYSIASYFEFELRQASGVGVPVRGADKKLTLRTPSQEVWELYAMEKAVYWRDFVQKWVNLSSQKNVLTFRYEEIVSDKPTIERLFDFAYPDHSKERLEFAIQGQLTGLMVGKNPNRDLSKFRFEITDELVERIRHQIGPDLIKKSGLIDVV